jgi:hypothetical protein
MNTIVKIKFGSRFIDRTGQKFGRLTLEYPVKLKNVFHWVCLCDCEVQ